ncbi:MAG: penicillin-insensitive murein endopeptidase [Archangium sp.]
MTTSSARSISNDTSAAERAAAAERARAAAERAAAAAAAAQRNSNAANPSNVSNIASARTADRNSVPGYSGTSSFEASPTSSMADARAADRASMLGYTGNTLRRGAEGESVRALQQRLEAAGHDVGEVDGKFGPRTERALRNYQRANGLQVDGVAGPRTYDSLNGVRNPGGTQAADGTTSVNADRPVGGAVNTQLPDSGQGFTTYGPRRMQYGTEQTVTNVQEIARRYQERTGKTLEVGDISQQGGGRTDRHQTHINGTDVDLRPPSRNGGPSNWRNADYDRDATRALIQEIRRTNPNARILFNDPVLIREGLVSAARGHDNHLHVSFR